MGRVRASQPNPVILGLEKNIEPQSKSTHRAICRVMGDPGVKKNRNSDISASFIEKNSKYCHNPQCLLKSFLDSFRGETRTS
jgi:hypothetical protein